MSQLGTLLEGGFGFSKSGVGPSSELPTSSQVTTLMVLVCGPHFEGSRQLEELCSKQLLRNGAVAAPDKGPAGSGWGPEKGSPFLS